MTMIRNYHEKMDKRMFDFPGFYNEMAEKVPEGATIAEVGIADGASIIFLAEALLNLGKKFTLYGIDNLDYGGPEQLRTVMSHIGKANLGEHITLIPRTSLDAACGFPDVHFDFVFIDASHRIEYTKADIVVWYMKMKMGGILAGHDYNDKEGREVVMAVNQIIPPKIKTDIGKVNPKEIIQTDQNLNIWKIQKRPELRLRTF